MSSIRPFSAAEEYHFKDDGVIPNSPLPLVIYREALMGEAAELVTLFEQAFGVHGWTNSWRNGVYSFHHYHSNTHEVLAVWRGTATLHMGGEAGARVDAGPGDVIVIPAGVGHKNLSCSADFAVAGAYPDGRDPDLLQGDPADRPGALERIAGVPVPSCDPIFGAEGPLLEIWGRK